MKKKKLAAFALCVCAIPTLFADGVTRSVEAIAGGAKVTLAWNFTSKVESDLIIEEHFSSGWAVDSATVPFSSLDASWFNSGIAKFAVKPSLLSAPGSITFTVAADAMSASGSVSGNWMMYLSGTLSKGVVSGVSVLTAIGNTQKANLAASEVTATASSTSTDGMVETAVAITSFKVVSGGSTELSYSGVSKSGVVVVYGCEGLGKSWLEVKREAVAAGNGTVTLTKSEVAGCCFFKIKLFTEE